MHFICCVFLVTHQFLLSILLSLTLTNTSSQLHHPNCSESNRAISTLNSTKPKQTLQNKTTTTKNLLKLTYFTPQKIQNLFIPLYMQMSSTITFPTENILETTKEKVISSRSARKPGNLTKKLEILLKLDTRIRNTII